MNLKKVVTIVVVFSLVFCSCGKKIPDVVQRDSNANWATPVLKSEEEIEEIEKNRTIFRKFIYLGSDEFDKYDLEEGKTANIKIKIEYDKEGRRKNCTLDDYDSCCFKSFGVKGYDSCKAIKDEYRNCRGKIEKVECKGDSECEKKRDVDLTEMEIVRDARCPGYKKAQDKES